MNGSMLEEFDQKAELVVALSRDCMQGLELQERDPENQYLRRCFVRSFFAYLEGSNHQMKHLTLLFHEKLRVDFSVAEVAMLREEGYEVDHQGRATTKRRSPDILANLKLTIKSFARLCQLPVPEDFFSNEEGFDQVQAAVRIRNGLMHPKTIEDLVVDDAKWQTVLDARFWYDLAVLQLFQNAALRERIQRIDEQQRGAALS
jgi:hypothetical protein